MELVLFALLMICFFAGVGSAIALLSINKKIRYVALIVMFAAIAGAVACGVALHGMAPAQ